MPKQSLYNIEHRQEFTEKLGTYNTLVKICINKIELSQLASFLYKSYKLKLFGNLHQWLLMRSDVHFSTKLRLCLFRAESICCLLYKRAT